MWLIYNERFYERLTQIKMPVSRQGYYIHTVTKIAWLYVI